MRAESAAAVSAPAPSAAPAAALSLAEVAGTWSARAVPESGPDTSPTLYELKATGDTTGWTMTFPGRKAIPMHVVAVSGDSVVVHAGPYESARRKGMQVTTDGVMRMQGGRLVGRTVAHYRTKGPDSVLALRTEATKKP